MSAASLPVAKGLAVTLAGLRHTFVVRRSGGMGAMVAPTRQSRPVTALTAHGQVCDPTQPDCPIVYASDGHAGGRGRVAAAAPPSPPHPHTLRSFYEMTGYSAAEVLGHNWRARALS